MRSPHAVLVAVTALVLAGCSQIAAPGEPATGVSNEMRQMHLSVIRGLCEQDKSQAALAFLDDYDRRFPGDPEAKAIRGDALLRTGQRNEAEKIFRVLYDTGHRPAADFGLGQAYAARDDWETASRHFSDAVGLAPTNARYLNNYGYALLKIGRREDAYQALARATQLDPGDRRARNNYLLAAILSGHKTQAERVLGTIGSSERASIIAFANRWAP